MVSSLRKVRILAATYGSFDDFLWHQKVTLNYVLISWSKTTSHLVLLFSYSARHWLPKQSNPNWVLIKMIWRCQCKCSFIACLSFYNERSRWYNFLFPQKFVLFTSRQTLREVLKWSRTSLPPLLHKGEEESMSQSENKLTV